MKHRPQQLCHVEECALVAGHTGTHRDFLGRDVAREREQRQVSAARVREIAEAAGEQGS